ncbi:DUF4931 domain-containing protein [Cytobacillus sp. FSL R5-0569]|uniref:DUF4931 domain-containing protein n=1 Tax=Cytobacillus TaxID=2675230 RepID=UPI00277F77BE|nr:DUF4931 domain-containing protein [Cytobacillus kochii]MDQ0187546.1 galactose-1-phosphate uridylyltransferase [Cytobacillus kochii]
MKNTHLFFNTSIGKQKPNSIRNKEQVCPFCQREQLTKIIAEDGPIIWLENKYPVLENAHQTVLIETDQCDTELSQYDDNHLVRLITFGLDNWLSMEKSDKYKSVIFFKNHGPHSGGSIAHPHMQIVGLYDVVYQNKVQADDFVGELIDQHGDTEFSLSNKPRIGFYEFNVKLGQKKDIAAFAKYIQMATKYILRDFPFTCNSYNLFFYHFENEIYAKIVPRYVTSPLFIGYFLPQVPNNIMWMVKDIQSKYVQL